MHVYMLIKICLLITRATISEVGGQKCLSPNANSVLILSFATFGRFYPLAKLRLMGMKL